MESLEPLPFFKNALEKLQQPNRKLVEIANYYWYEDYFRRYIVKGDYLGEPCTTNAWFIIGVAPEYKDFIDCWALGNERNYWIGKLKEIVQIFDDDYHVLGVSNEYLKSIVHDELDSTKIHAVGMITLHRIIKEGYYFALLHQHPNEQLDINLVKHIIKHGLIHRLKFQPP